MMIKAILHLDARQPLTSGRAKIFPRPLLPSPSRMVEALESRRGILPAHDQEEPVHQHLTHQDFMQIHAMLGRVEWRMCVNPIPPSLHIQGVFSLRQEE